MKPSILMRIFAPTLFVLLLSFSLQAQVNSSTFVSCSSGGCVTTSNITLIGVTPGANPGDPATILGGETFEVCYEVTGWNYVNINWFAGAEPVVGPGLIDPGPDSSISASGVNETWIWNSYCTTNCCDSSGDNSTNTPNNVCGPPNTGAWLFGVDSDSGVCQGGSANDGEFSNNRGDSGSGGFEFCIDIEADCGPLTTGVISSEIAWNVYSDSDMGTWGYGNATNNCGCEGGSEECSIDIDVICCEQPDVTGGGQDDSEILVNNGTSVECTDQVVSLSIEGDINNPDYEYQWGGPEGSGPNSAVWDASSNPPFPIPPSDGIYTLSVFNIASGDCVKEFETELFAGGVASGSDITVCAGSGVVVEIPVNASQIGGPACNLPGVSCLTSSDPSNPNESATIFIDPKVLGLGQVGTHTYSAFIGQTGTSCFSLGSYTLTVLSPPIENLQIDPPSLVLCNSIPIEDQLPVFSIQNPTPGITYGWSFSESCSEDVLLGFGTSIDISSEFDPDITNASEQDLADLIQRLYVFPRDGSTSCVGEPTAVDITFEACGATCPENINDTSDQDVCDGSTLDLQVTYDNFGIVEWDLPTNPTTVSGETISYIANSLSGCSDTQTINYTIVCDEDLSIEAVGSITLQIFVEPTGQVIVSDDGCTISAESDCPEFVISNSLGFGDTFTTFSGDAGTIDFIFLNSGAPIGCDNENITTVAYNCLETGIADLPTGISTFRMNQQLFIQNQGEVQQIERLVIYNVSGQKVWEQQGFSLNTGVNTIPFNLEHQIYLLYIQGQDYEWSRVF